MAAISELLSIGSGALEVALVPQIGGSVSSLRWRGIDLMGVSNDVDVLAVQNIETGVDPARR